MSTALTSRPAPATFVRSRRLSRDLVQVAAAVVIMCVMGLVFGHSHVDLPITQALNHFHHGVIGSVTTSIYAALEPPFAVVYTLVIAAWFWRRHTLRYGLAFGVAVAATWLPVVAFKLLFTRPRPDAHLLEFPTAVSPHDWSFPSGHTAFIVALMVALTMALRSKRMGYWGALVAVVVMACPLVNGLHFPTDVLASVLWSLLVAPVIWDVTQGFRGDSPRRVPSE